jgi:hypothetical protein
VRRLFRGREVAPLSGIPGAESWRSGGAGVPGVPGVPGADLKQPAPAPAGTEAKSSRLSRRQSLVHSARRVLAITGSVCLAIGIIAVITALPGEGVEHTVLPLLLVGAGVGAVGGALLLAAFLIGRATAGWPQPEPRPMSSAALTRTLERAGITERAQGDADSLFSESVLLVRDRRIYDQQGNVRATLTKSPNNPSFRKRLFLDAPLIWDVVDTDGRILLELRNDGREADPVPNAGKTERPKTFRAVAAGGDEIATVLVRVGRNRRMPIQAAGATIGSLCSQKGNRNFSLRDTDDIEIGRVTQVRPRLGWLLYDHGKCNVIEIDDQMPGRLRPIGLAASEAVSYLTTPAG